MKTPEIGQSVICPCAPKYTPHGYCGRGYIGKIEAIVGDLIKVRFGKNGIQSFHKNNVSYLKRE